MGSYYTQITLFTNNFFNIFYKDVICIYKSIRFIHGDTFF